MDEIQSFISSVLIYKGFKSAVELGCAHGERTAELNAICPTVGVDISPEYIRLAKKAFPKVKFVCSDILKYKPKQKFDVAITQGLLIHVPPSRAKQAVRQILKIAKTALLTESSVDPMYEPKRKRKYNAKEYWQHRAKHPDPGDDLNMQYYFNHDYEKLFDELGLGWQIVKTFDIATKTRMYWLWQK